MRSALGDVLGLLLSAAVALLALPVGLVLAVALMLASGLGSLAAAPSRRARASRRVPARTSRSHGSASIMILSWNGRHLLERLLPSLREAVGVHGGAHEVIVIDNGSADDTAAWVAREFPEVKLVRHATNLMFVRGYAEAMAAATKDVVVFLNNDMVVERDFLRPLLEPFADPDVFAVSAQVFLADPTKRREETGLTSARLSLGLVKLAHDAVDPHLDGLLPTLWAGGGSSAVDRRAFLELGGFDRLYDPFYFEDTSLSLTAWKRGWKVLMAPASRVVHAHRATSGKLLPRGFVARRRARNTWLFAWRHFDSVRSTLATTLLLPLAVARLATRERELALPAAVLEQAAALAMALPRLPRVLAQRFAAKRLEARGEREVLALACHRHRFEAATRGGAAAPAPDAPLRLLMLMARLPRLSADGSWAQLEIVKALGKRHHVTLVALLERDDVQDDIERIRPLVARLETLPLVKVPRRPDLHHQVPPRLWSDYSGEEIRARIDHLLRSERYDAVQVDYVEMTHVAEGLCRGLPVVHVCHEPLGTVCAREPAPGPLARAARALRRMQAIVFERAAYSESACVVCLSDADARDLAATVPGLTVRVIKNGLDLGRIRPSPDAAPRSVVSFVGYYGHGPNVDAARWLALEIFPRVRAVVPQAQLWLVGKGASPALDDLARVPGVTVRGFVDDLAACLAETAVVAAPLRQGGGLRSKVLEAMAYGKAVVATTIGAAGVGARAGSEIVIADGTDELAARIAELLREPTRRGSIERAARARAESDFSIERTAREYEAVYREVAR